MFLDEIKSGVCKHRVWMRLAKMAIDVQYKQNTLGPLWITASTGALVTAFAFVYSSILVISLKEHIVYVAAGLICWYFYSAVIQKSCTVFVVNRSLILQLPLPISLHVFKLLYQESLIFCYNLIVLLLVCGIFKRSFGWELIMVLPAFLLIVINVFLIGFFLAVLSTRFRDVASSIQAVIAPMMFLTPILWNVETLSNRPAFVTWNPFYHIVEIWRSPIIGSDIPLFSWLFILFFTLIMFVLCCVIFNKYRNRIAFWL